MAQSNDNPVKIPANVPRLSDRIKKLNESVRLFIYKERGEEHGEKEITEVEHQGKIVGRFVKQDGEIVESHGSHDSQQSGVHRQAAKAVGQKKEDIIHTAPTEASLDAYEDAEKEDDVTVSDKAKLGSGSSKEVKPKSKPSESKKPDTSMSKMASMESAETQGAPDLSKSTMSVAAKMAQMAACCKKTSPLNKAYNIKSEPGKITYTKVTPEEQEGKPNVDPVKVPNWKTRWNAKTPQERAEFRAKMSAMRGPGKGLVKSEDDKKKDLNKSVYQKMCAMSGTLKKNAVAGYPMGVQPAIPMQMSKGGSNEIDKSSDVSGYKPPKSHPDLANARFGTSSRSPVQKIKTIKTISV